MNKFLLVTILFVVGACATPSSEPNWSESAGAPESAHAAKSGSDDMLVHNSSEVEEFEGIEEMKAPNARETPPEMIPGRAMPEPAIVCERVVPTGSILPVEVCRERAEIERRQEADQRIFEDIKRNTAIGTSRL